MSRLSYVSDKLENYTFDDLLSNKEDVDYKALFERYTPLADNLYIIDNIYDMKSIESCIAEFRDNNPSENIVVIIDYL